jgi:proteic killer suppression protein
MIKLFSDIETERLFTTGKSKRFPPDLLKRAIKRLTQIDAAMVIDDLCMPPSNHMEALSGKRTGQWSIRMNDQWRICFRFDNGEAYNVEIVDYH